MKPWLKTLGTVVLALAVVIVLRVAQNEISAATWIYCRAELAYTYACQVWLRQLETRTR